ncbi:tripartite motif-containing protein 45-like isoform X5 [Dreissena polymorpha]|uniref:tripartite motif-containing protein 45-like isoform X5 n=1 Tax=Dreissena polymorpha TaxID=45954 RepID=UPI00226500BF|nr:tripartite motif-containing protein 45-like isoform X5 [Dreissena polymorpha]
MASNFENCGFCFNEPVFGFCENCTVRLGKKCFELHKNAPGHITFQLDTSKKLASGPLIREKDIHQQKCSLHVTENLALYCEKHDATVCGRCIRTNHMICKDSIVDLHEITFDKQRTSERITTLKNLEQEICTIEKHIEENLKSNNECKETYLNAIEKYYKELLTRLDKLVSQSKNAGNVRYAQNEENLKKVQVKCKDTKRHIQEQTNTIQELSEKNQQKHLYIISKRLEKELQNLNSVIRQSSLENTIVKFSFERNSKLQTLLQNTIQEIGTLQEACEGSDEVCDQPGIIQTDIPSARSEIAVDTDCSWLESRPKYDINESNTNTKCMEVNKEWLETRPEDDFILIKSENLADISCNDTNYRIYNTCEVSRSLFKILMNK